ncbi:MAG: thioredoxin [Lentisphaeria bacterium]|nr:thioredoxin [Lentisphaeria bacterium]
MDAVHLNKESLSKLLGQNAKAVLVDFWAEWCGPCQMMGPVLEQIAAERDDLIVEKINVDEYPDLAGEYSVDTIPALLLFRNGKLEKRVAGFMNKDVLLSRLGL